MTIKICTKCKEPKDADADFSWSIRGIKRHSRCKSCHAEERADYYARNKEKELEYKYDRQKERRDEGRKYVWEYLSTHPCQDCGEYDPLVLTFDHVRGNKKMNISQMINQGYVLDVLKEEIDKCEVVCNNCHLRREKKRRGTKYW
jgi:hypothetical protein